MSFDWIREQLADLSARDLLRSRLEVIPLPEGRCRIAGRELLNLATNDYLGLAGHPRVIAAARVAMEEFGTGSRASALVAGRTSCHEQLERVLAEFEGTEAALLFPSGMAANLGTLGALLGPEDIVFCDRWNHASLIDGCRNSGARFRVYRHEQLSGLSEELASTDWSQYRRRFLVTDSVFSMDGDVAPLAELVDLCEPYRVQLIVDEAHATGVLGPAGRGLVAATGLHDPIAVRIGTLSKALGSIGGFVAGPRVLIDWLFQTARTQIYSTALPAASCAAAMAALELLQSAEDPAARLRTRCAEFRRQLAAAIARTGFPVSEWCGAGFDFRSWFGPEGDPSQAGQPAEILDEVSESALVSQLSGGVSLSAETAIIPLIIGDPQRTMRLAEQLRAGGIFVAAVRTPTVPRGTDRLRLSLSLAHQDSDLAVAVDRIVHVMRSNAAG